MVTLNHTMQYGMCMVHVTLVTSMKQWNKLTKNVLHGKTQEYKTWEENHLQGKAGCDGVINWTVLGMSKKGLAEPFMSFKVPLLSYLMANQ